MPSWLEVEDLRVHMNLPEDAVPADSAIETRMTDALNATMELVDDTTGVTWDDEESLPARVREASLIQAARLFKRDTAPLGIATVGTVDSQMGAGTRIGMRLLAKLDPDVELLLDKWQDYSAL